MGSNRTVIQKHVLVNRETVGDDIHTAEIDADGNLQVEVTNTDPVPVSISGGSLGVSELDEGSDVHYSNITGTGDTAVVAATADEKTRVHMVTLSNNDIPCEIQMRFGSGTYFWRVRLASKGAVVPLYFSPAIVSSANNEAFNVKSDTASVDVDVTVHADTTT